MIDCHTHSAYSPDAKDSAEKMVLKAEQLGLEKYAVTDHCDVNFWNRITDENTVDFDMYGSGDYALQSIEKVSQMKKNHPILLCGIELGQPLQNIEKAEIIANDSRLDFIIGSQHMNKNENDFYYLQYDKTDRNMLDRLMHDYFIQVLEMCRWGKFQILGHLTYPLRYICGEYGIEIDLSKYDEIIREIFKTVISNGAGIEVNTSGIRQKYGRTFPDFDYVKLYHELGGEIITPGSDSHCADDIAKGIKEGEELVKSAGFEYIAYFENKQANFIRL